MANEGGGKMKIKRHTEGNKPYGRRSSLLGKVTDTVKDMLSPSWLVDLVQSVKKKTPPLGSESEHTIPMRNHYMHSVQNDGSSFIQSEMSRPGVGGGGTAAPDLGRFHMGGPGNEMPSTHNTHGFTSAQLPLNSLRQPFQGFSHVNGGDDHSEHSDYSISTSGSVVPQLEQRQGALQPNTQHNKGMNTSHVSQGQNRRFSDNSFLWSKSQPAQPQTSLSNRSHHKPSFNISAFGSTPTSPDNSLFGSSYHKSPYYPGKTTFGGAAAHRKSRQHSPSPYQLTPQRKTVTAKPVNKSEASSVTSSTAKRILDTLERMSTPLSNGPPVTRRSTPSLASIATNRQPITARKPPAQSDQPITAQNDLSPNEKTEKINNNDEYYKQTPLGGGSRKMKQERGMHYSTKDVDDEVVDVPALSTEFTLPVVAPSFNFGFTPATSTSTPPAASSRSSGRPAADSLAKIPANSATNGAFTFSSPISKGSPGHTNEGVLVTSPKTFQFSSPMSVDEDEKKKTTLPVAPPSGGFQFNTAPKPKQFIPNVCLMLQPAGDSFTGLFKKPAGSWECGTCLIQNKPEVEKCAACGTPRPKPKTSTPSTRSTAKPAGGNLAGLFKKPVGSWECDTCMIQNKPEVTKCAACETPHPKPKSNAASKTSGSSALAQYRLPSGGWTCDTCLVENKPEVTKCAACESPKPGAKPVATSTPVVTSGQGFNLPKKLSGQWECDTCLVSNAPEKLKCVACETPKPGVKPTTGFTTSGGFKFAAASTDSSKPSPFSLAPTTSAGTAPPPSGGFKFGTPATTATSTGGFTMNTAAVSKEDTPKVSPFTFGAQSANNNKVSDASAAPPGGGFKFDAPSSTSSEKSSESAAQQQPPTAGGFKFNVGSNDSSPAVNKPEAGPAPPPSGGFKFGVQETSEAGLKPASTAGVGGFSFGQKHDSNAAKPRVGGATGLAAPLSGGFTFGGAGGSSTATTTTVATTTGKSEAFTAPPVAAAAKTEPKVEFKPVFGSQPDVTASFGAKKPESTTTSSMTVTAAATTNVTTTTLFQFKPTATTTTAAASIGGSAPTFSFSAGPLGGSQSTGSTRTTGAVPAFNMTSGGSATKASPLKRGHDDEGVSSVKKATFSFTGSGSGQPAAPTDPFKFGATSAATTTTTAPSSSLFTFSANKSTASAPAPSGGVFGAPPTKTSAPSFAAPVFGGFGAQSSGFGAPTPAAPFGGSSATLMFGAGAPATNTAAAPAPPAFGAPPAQTTTASSGFSFNMTPSFSFGGTGASKPGVISFSANSQQSSSNSGFSFGGSGAPTTQPAAGSTGGSCFNFSAGPAQNPAAPAPPAAGSNIFQFSASSAGGAGATPAASNPFSMTAASGGQSGNRRIKRAVRKVKR